MLTDVHTYCGRTFFFFFLSFLRFVCTFKENENAESPKEEIFHESEKKKFLLLVLAYFSPSLILGC